MIAYFKFSHFYPLVFQLWPHSKVTAVIKPKPRSVEITQFIIRHIWFLHEGPLSRQLAEAGREHVGKKSKFLPCWLDRPEGVWVPALTWHTQTLKSTR